MFARRPSARARAQSLARVLFLAAFVLASPGCYVQELPPPVYAGYWPAFYNGYVVYYDSVGRPYYYSRGVAVWVSPASPYYFGLMGHWRRYGPGYPQWYRHQGYRYHDYRRPHR